MLLLIAILIIAGINHLVNNLLITYLKCGWSYLRYCSPCSPGGKNATPLPQINKSVKEGLSVIDVEQCREACNSTRERAVFEFLLASACRVGETHNLLYSDVITGEFHVLEKGSKVRSVIRARSV